MRFTPRPVLVVLGVGALSFAACSNGSEAGSDAPVSSAVAVDENAAATFNEADVLFAQGMIPHHREAVTMAEMALAPDAAASAEVQALATRIQAAQSPEIDQFTNLLETWGQPVDMPGMSAGMDHDGDMDESHDMGQMEGMMSEDEMEALGSSSGSEFDAAWISSMIAHHEGAVSMSQKVKESGSNPEVLALADAIIAGQQAEIEEMQQLADG